MKSSKSNVLITAMQIVEKICMEVWILMDSFKNLENFYLNCYSYLDGYDNVRKKTTLS